MLGAIRKLIHDDLGGFSQDQMEEMANGWCLKGGGGGGSTTTVQKADPWEGQQPYLTGDGRTGIFPEAERLYDTQNLSYYPGQTYANFAPETQLGLAAQTNRALGGSPLTNTMQGELQKTLQGDYLDATKNPYLLGLGEQITAKVLPQIDARFAQSGRGDSGLGRRAAAEGVTDALANVAYKNYGDERNRQMQSMMFAPQAAQQDYFDIAKLSEVGGVREDLAQQGINEAMQRHQYNQMAPWEQLGMYHNLLQGTYGGQSQSTMTPQRRSLGANMLGGGLAGAGLGYGAASLFPQTMGSLGLANPGMGALAGGGLGLMGGLLF